jgi:hypothetical protein
MYASASSQKKRNNNCRRRPTFPPTQDRLWHVLCQDLQPGKPNAARSTSAAPTAAAALIKNHHLLSISALTHHHPHTMSVSALIRSAGRARATPFARPAPRALFMKQRAAFSVSAGRFAGDIDAHDPHREESFEEFTARYACFLCFLGGEARERVLWVGWGRWKGGDMVMHGKGRILAQWLHWACA